VSGLSIPAVPTSGLPDGAPYCRLAVRLILSSPAALVVRYSDQTGDLSNVAGYEQFRCLLMTCLKRCYDALEPGGRMAVLIGDVRRQGRYTAIIRDVLNFPHGEIRSVIIKVQHNCTSDRRSYGKLEDPPIKHEYCVVFRKRSDEVTENHDGSSLPVVHSGGQPGNRSLSHMRI
jgi:hypothetical protein